MVAGIQNEGGKRDEGDEGMRDIIPSKRRLVAPERE